MKAPSIKTPRPVGALGAVKNDLAKIGANDSSSPACQCHIVGAICLACRRWDRTIRGIEQRRADSLRMQSFGHCAGGAT